MTKKRHLRDLYVRGKVHTFDDGTGEEPVTLFIKKMNKTENEEAVRRANAARARVLASLSDKQSDRYLSTLSEVQMTPRDTLVDYVISEDLAKRYESVESELAESEEWSKDGYLQGLQDAWKNGLSKRYAEEPDDPEAKRVFDEMKRFTDAVNVIVEGEAESLRRGVEHMLDEELEEKATTMQVKIAGDMAWLDEYRKCEVFFSARDFDDHRTKYFESRDEIDELETETLLDLIRTYRSIGVEPQEGKDLQETPTS